MKLLWPLISAAILAAALSACSASNVNDIPELEVQTARAQAAAQRAQVLAALEPLDPLRYHQHDGTIRNDGRIPADAVIWATRARETLDWVDWPVELEAHVAQYAEWLDALLAAMRDDDAAAAAEPSRITHALAHTFEAALEAWLGNDTLPDPPLLAGLEPPSHDAHDDAHDGADGQMSMEGDDDAMPHEQHAGQDADGSDEHAGHEDDNDGE